MRVWRSVMENNSIFSNGLKLACMGSIGRLSRTDFCSGWNFNAPTDLSFTRRNQVTACNQKSLSFSFYVVLLSTFKSNSQLDSVLLTLRHQKQLKPSPPQTIDRRGKGGSRGLGVPDNYVNATDQLTPWTTKQCRLPIYAPLSFCFAKIHAKFRVRRKLIPLVEPFRGNKNVA